MNDDHTSIARFHLTKVIGGYRISPLSAADIPLIREFCQTADELSRLRQGDLVFLIGELMLLASQRGFEITPRGQLDCPTLCLSRTSPPPPTSPWRTLRGKYAAHHSISDFYPEYGAALETALKQPHPFDTGWFGAKKEIEYARLTRAELGGSLQVRVRCEADDGIAQADTAFWQAAGGNDVCTCGADALAQRGLSKQAIADALAALAASCALGESVEATLETTLPFGTTLEQLGDTLDELADRCNAVLDARTAQLNERAREQLAHLRND